MIQETNYNEIIEFFKQFSFIFNLLIFSLLFLIFTIFITLNLTFSPIYLSLLNSSIIFTITVFLTYYLWKNGENEKKQGVFVRTGIIELFFDVKKYIQTTFLL